MIVVPLLEGGSCIRNLVLARRPHLSSFRANSGPKVVRLVSLTRKTWYFQRFHQY